MYSVLHEQNLRSNCVLYLIFFIIMNKAALAKGEMTRTRWLSGLITYLVPYSVNIHGQYINSRKSIKN
ncbi:MAG: nitrate/nitrite transporter NrtS [Pleurocapsa sp. MO_226.B13]|nr:nitrate/nitrite transporter NrtS [Pleurocapsa sp. MO_226.B13]